MKRAISALCVLLLTGGAAYGAAYTWDGQIDDTSPTANSRWSTADNWVGDSGYPDDGSDCLDTVTIDDTSVRVPAVDGTYCIASLAMGNGTEGSPTQVNTRTNTLSVNGTFTVNGSSYVEKITGSGTITAETLVINGGSTLKVSAGTIQTADVP